MAEKEFEFDDPYELVGMRVPLEPGVDGDEAMARSFIEEYALLGMPPGRILRLFHSPFYAGTHRVLRERGEHFVRQLIGEVFGAPAQEVS